jgi:type I restriction enzyme S subunit
MKEFLCERRGTAFNLDRIKEIYLPIPSLNEQRRIVSPIEELTRRVEEARRLCREADLELAAFTPALLAKAFRGEL